VTKDREQALSKAEAAYRRSSGRPGRPGSGRSGCGKFLHKIEGKWRFIAGKTIGKP